MKRGDGKKGDGGFGHLIPGRHAVKEALSDRASRPAELWVVSGRSGQKVDEILSLAEEMGIPVHFKENEEFKRFLGDVNHQGVALLSEPFSYVTLDRIVGDAHNDRGYGLVVVADHITDEGNLGALIRTAAFFGIHGLVLPKDRSAKVTERVQKRSSGGATHLSIARVINLGRALDMLDEKGFWIVGAAEEGSQSIYHFDWTRDLVLVLGNEEKGLSRAVKKRCHQLVKIASPGWISSLNVSVAGGIILSEVVRQRGEGFGG
jgi:23S rRNA (guanosine2251-2'-O)-methyltransferase